MFKKLMAGITSIALALGMVALTAGPAAADTPLVGTVGQILPWSNATNSPDYWEDYGPHDDADCYSHSGNSSHGSITDGGLTVTLAPYGDDWPGDHWELLVIKGGSVSNNVIVHPQPGVAYASPLNGSGNQANVSHWIVCKGTTPPTSVTPAAPTFTDAVCIGAGQVGQGSYTIPATTGVRYEVNISNDGQGAFEQGVGTYPVAVGKTVEVWAYALPGYVLTGNDDWDDTITGPAADKCVVAPAPTPTYSVCKGSAYPGESTQAKYVVPSSTVVKFQKWNTNTNTWQDIAAGTYNVNTFPTQVKLQAVAINGKTIVPGSTVSWTFDFVSAGACLVIVYPLAPAISDSQCQAPGVASTPQFFISTTTGVQYQVNEDGEGWGNIGSGWHDATPGSTYEFRALALPGYSVTVTDLGSHTFAIPDCIEPATPQAEAIEPICVVEQTEEKSEPVLGPSYVRVYWNTGIASYDIEGYGVVNNPEDGSTYTDVATGEPLDELTVTPTAKFGYEPTVASVTVTFGPKIINQCGDGLIGDPIATDEICVRGVGDGGSVWVERMEGLRYTITGGNLVDPIVIDGVGEPGDPYLDGTVPLDVGDYQVDTSALPGYVLTPDPANLPFVFTIHEPEENCVISITLNCAVDEEGFLYLPAIDHVEWTVHVPSSGNPPVTGPGPLWVEITIAATHITATIVDPGYVFSDQQTSWSFQIEEGELECGELTTLPPVPTNVTWTAERCVAGQKVGATVTVGQVNDENWFPEVEYTLDGTTVLTSITTPISAGAHTVTAAVRDPDDSIEQGSLDFWEFNVPAAPTTCDLTTLALTGSNPIGWAGLGYYLLITGLALIAVRTVRRRSEVK